VRNTQPPHALDAAKLWILLSAFLSAAGVALSFFHRLDLTGYLAVLTVGIALCIAAWRCGVRIRLRFCLGKWRWRRRHLLPALFVLLAALATIGGLLYAPNNYDGLTYRFPRILHWLVEHRWHWIATDEPRMNLSATGFEWFMVPLFVFTRGDRLFFLPNIAAFLLMPGMFYGMLVQLGAKRRVAWHWMWLLPAGYCFLAQAGSIGNDSLAAVYLLASVYFALKARQSKNISDLWYATIAAALVTGIKSSNVPLLLPWMLAMLPSLRLLKTRLTGTLAVAVVFLVVSVAPVGWHNLKHTGDWTGDPFCRSGMKMDSAFYGVTGNVLELFARNAMPPVMPFARSWNAEMDRLKNSPRFQTLLRHFPRFTMAWNELEQEEAAGLGVGLCVLALATLIAGLRHGELHRCWTEPNLRWGGLICASGALAFLFYMAKMGSESASRIVAAYYPLVVAGPLLLPGAGAVMRKRWWRVLACAAALSAVPLVVLTPSRPLWPALTVFRKLAAASPQNRLLERGRMVYEVYGNRADCLAPLRKYLPADRKTVGLVSGDVPQVSLWRPFGTRRVVDVIPANQARFATRSSIVVASDDAVKSLFGQSMPQWIVAMHGRVLAKEALVTKLARGSQDWYIIETGVASRSAE